MMRFVTPADWESVIKKDPRIIPEQFPFRERLIKACSKALSNDNHPHFNPNCYNCHRFVAEVIGVPLTNYMTFCSPVNLRRIAVPNPEAGDPIIFTTTFHGGGEFASHSALTLVPEKEIMDSLTIGKTDYNLPVMIQTLGEFYATQRAQYQRENIEFNRDNYLFPVHYFVPHDLFFK